MTTQPGLATLIEKVREGAYGNLITGISVTFTVTTEPKSDMPDLPVLRRHVTVFQTRGAIDRYTLTRDELAKLAEVVNAACTTQLHARYTVYEDGWEVNF